MRRIIAPTLVWSVLALPAVAGAQSLNGSDDSMYRQNEQARRHDYTFLRSSWEVHDFVDRGVLVPVSYSASDYRLADVSFPYARPEVRTFVQRLAGQYRSACGERLVITSLTRPESRQPRNSHFLSVHPAGMAVDLRKSRRSSCRRWLEGTLLSLERKGVIEATRERRPAHYHIAVFPAVYRDYVAALGGEADFEGHSSAGPRLAEGTDESNGIVAASAVAPVRKAAQPVKLVPKSSIRYKVRRGDTLWSISRRYGATVTELKRANGLRSGQIKAGQTLRIPRKSKQAR